jgi:hypothetical protein
MNGLDKKLLIIIILLLSVIIAGCSPSVRYQNSIFDDEEKIIANRDSFTYRHRIGNNSEDELDLKYASFSGIETVYKITTEEKNNVTFDFESEVEKGDFKVVLITPDSQVVDIIHGTHEGSETIPIKEGISKIKLVGKRAKGHIKIKISADKDVEVEEVGRE